MPRQKSRTLTDAELRIMEILWARGPATVAEVAEALKGKDGTAYTTILTMMRILRAKHIRMQTGLFAVLTTSACVI